MPSTQSVSIWGPVPTRFLQSVTSPVTDRYRLDQINEACTALRVGDIMGRAIIEYAPQ